MKKLSDLDRDKIGNAIKALLHAGFDGMRNRGEDTTKGILSCNDPYYGECFGIVRALALLGYGELGSVIQQEGDSWNVRAWLEDLLDEVKQEENVGGNNQCDFCFKTYGKDSVRGKRVEQPSQPKEDNAKFWQKQREASEKNGYLRGRQEATAELARVLLVQPKEVNENLSLQSENELFEEAIHCTYQHCSNETKEKCWACLGTGKISADMIDAACPWSSRIGYDCELADRHEGNHIATDLDGKSKVGWNDQHRSAYRRQMPRTRDAKEEATPPVCTTCNDTHRMTLHRDGHEDQLVACTRCPTPCEECRSGGNGRPRGAFCETTPCRCTCHSEDPFSERFKKIVLG